VTNAKVTTDKTTFGGFATVACACGFAGGGTAKCSITGWTELPKCTKSGAACPPGKFTKADKTCADCIAGKFQDRQGQNSSSSYAAGKTQTKASQKSCDACQAGQSSAAVGRTTACDACSAGKYQDAQGQSNSTTAP